MNLKNIYNNQIYERYNHPKHKVTLAQPTSESGVYNPSCGDKVTVQILIQNGVVTEIGHHTQGCVISGGAADLICEYSLGKTAEMITSLTPEAVFTIIGMKLGPNRLRCAFITVEALQHALTAPSTLAKKQE